MSPLPCTHIRKSYIEKKSPRSANPAARDVHSTPHWNLSFECFRLLRLGAQKRWGGGREGWAESIHSPKNKRSHFQAGSRLGAQRTPESRGRGPDPTSLSTFPPPAAEHNGARIPPGPSFAAAHSSLLSRAQQVRGSRRRRMNESESQAPRCPGHPAPSSWAGREVEDEAEVSTGVRPSPGRRLIPRRGQESGARSPGRAAAPAPPPLLLAPHAPRRRLAPPSSARAPPPPHTSITARLRRPPAPARQRSGDSGGPEARRCLCLHRSVSERRAPLPGSAPPARAQHGGRAGCGGEGGDGAGRTGARAVPPPARGRRQEAAAAAEPRPGAGDGGADRSPGPCLQQEEAAAGRMVVPSRSAWELVRHSSPSVRPSLLSVPLP